MTRRAALAWTIASLVAVIATLVAGGAGGGARAVGPAAVVLLALLGVHLLRRRQRTLSRVLEALHPEGSGPPPARMPRNESEAEHRLDAAIRARLASEREAVTKLAVERNRLNAVLNEMKIGLLLVGEDVRIRRANLAARQFLGATEEPRGRSLAALVRDPEILETVEQLVSGPEGVASKTLRISGSDRQFEVQLTRLSSHGGAGPTAPRVLVQLYEISRLERLEAVRRDFVANVSHELRTPLTSIQAAVETLEDETLGPDDTRRFVDIIRRQAGRMAELVEDLTDLSQIETGSVELSLDRLDVRRLTQEVIDQLRPLAERLDVTVRNELPAPDPIRADRRRLEQMLTNLVHNAIKFNRPGGTVRIFEGKLQGSIAVSDDGIGIPFDARERIFNRFFQVEQARSREIGGTGLGLAITKHLMRLHGGRVRVESELGKGSTFYLEFPVDSPAPSPEPTSNEAAKPAGSAR